MALATIADVEARLKQADQHLATDDPEYTDGLLDEASVLVIGYLGCDPTDTTVDPEVVPQPVVIVTSRMVARVLRQEDGGGSGDSATGILNVSGPFSQQRQFAAGTTSGAPWIAATDKQSLDPYRCAGKAFSIDTAPRGTCIHSEVCSANDYLNYPPWLAFCTCGADIAGEPIFGSLP